MFLSTESSRGPNGCGHEGCAFGVVAGGAATGLATGSDHGQKPQADPEGVDNQQVGPWRCAWKWDK